MRYRLTDRRLFLAGAAIAALAIALRRQRRRPAEAVRPTGPHVLILGGGWAGIYTALALERVLPEASLTLVNRDNFFLFTPLLPEVAASAVDTRHIVNPIRRLFRRAQFVEGDVEAIDLVARRVTTRHPSGHQHEHRYDHLVLALGGVSNFFGMQDVARQSIPMKSLGDAILLRNHVIEMLEQADIEHGELRKELATFVLVGGGLNGVEVAGNLNDFVREALPTYQHIPPEDVRIILVEAQARLMPEVSAGLASFALRKLQQRGVAVWLNTRVSGATGYSVRFGDGRELRARTLVWLGGVAGNPLLASLPLQLDKQGRVVVDSYMGVPGYPGVWALGDCAAVPKPEGGVYPPTAQHALREARGLAGNIAAAVRGSPLNPFAYPLRVQLAAIGHQAGVADIMGFKLSGLLAWWLWRTYYLWRLPRLEKRLRVMLDWTLDLLFPRDLVQIQYAQIGAAARGPERPTATEDKPAEQETGAP